MRLFEDGFDHYGADKNNMLDGVYATAGYEVSFSDTIVATGTHSIFISGDSPDLTNNASLRKVLPASKDKMGAIGRFYFPSLPSGNIGGTIFDFLTSDPVSPQVTCLVDANGAIRFIRGRNYFTVGGENGTLIAQSDPVIVAAAWNHIEVQIYIHDTAGWVRVAVNGIHRFQATGLDTKVNSDNIVSVSQSSGISGGVGAGSFYMDDYQLYDFTGTPATDTDFCPTYDGGGLATGYIGELDVRWRFCNGDTSENDWLPSTGSAIYPLIGKATPDDTTYAYSTTVGDLTEQNLEDLPEEITYIRGLTVWGRLSKSDSGAAMIKHGMESGTDHTDAAERPVTVEPTYWWDQVNVDPHTSTRWTRTSFNASHARITRSV